MNDRFPFVSIIVPVYNGERYIGDCIKSLLALNYPASKIEIIIVDNKSSDSTYRVIQQFPVISLMEDRVQGSYAARNAGVRCSRGEIIAFTDSDCIADKDWVGNGVAHFDDEDVGCVAGRIEGYSPSNYIEEYLIKNRCLSQEESTLKHWFLPYAQTANAIYRREVFDKIGFFEENWVSAGDADFTWRMLMNSRYKLAYGNDSTIYHVHRSTVRGYMRQRMTWGHGEVLLHKKYKIHYHSRGNNFSREMYRDYKDFILSVGNNLTSMIYKKYITRDAEGYNEKKLNMIGTVGRRIGRIKGSIKENIFYI